MPTVKEVLRSASATLGVDGWQARRVYFVDELTGGSSEIITTAATLPEIPAIGTKHPSVEAFVTSKEATPEGVFAARVTVNYTRPLFGSGGTDPTGTVERPLLSISSRLEVVTTNRIRGLDGDFTDAIKTYYKPGEGGQGRSAQAVGPNTDGATPQVGEVSAFVPRLVISLQRQEAVTGPDVLADAAEFIGKTNSGGFLNTRISALNDADTWLCTNAQANSTDGGLTFVRTFEFTWNPEKWNEMAVFIDPETGRPPQDVTIPGDNSAGNRGNGTLMVRVTGQADFNDLNLTLR